MRPRLAPIAFALAACACGAAPTAPAAAARYALAAGTYNLNIYPMPVDADGGSIMVCLSIGGGTAHSIAIPVTVDRDGPSWVARPSSGSLQMTLREVTAGVEGSLSGSFTLGSLTVTVASPGTSAVVSAPTVGASMLAGRIEGDVSYSNGGLQSSCNGNGWSLTAR